MLNKRFKKDWQMCGGEVNLIDTEHFSVSIDKSSFSVSISVSWKGRFIYIAIGHITFRFY